MMWYTCTTACVRKLNTAACDLIARRCRKPLVLHLYLYCTVRGMISFNSFAGVAVLVCVCVLYSYLGHLGHRYASLRRAHYGTSGLSESPATQSPRGLIV